VRNECTAVARLASDEDRSIQSPAEEARQRVLRPFQRGACRSPLQCVGDVTGIQRHSGGAHFIVQYFAIVEILSAHLRREGPHIQRLAEGSEIAFASIPPVAIVSRETAARAPEIPAAVSLFAAQRGSGAPHGGVAALLTESG
jgi:hypothetical protein